MSINVNIGYGASRITTHPDKVGARRAGDRIVIDADNSDRSEMVSLFLTSEQAEKIHGMLSFILGKST